MFYQCPKCDAFIMGEVVGGEVIDHDTPCPGCGGEKVPLFEKPDDTGFVWVMQLKVPRNGRRKAPIESRASVVRNRDGRWVQTSRTINRLDDSYTETVLDQLTGQEIHRCDEPLSAHQGHGSAKHRAQNPK